VVSSGAIYTRSIPLGRGFTESMHGLIPLPAPATIELLDGMKIRFTDVDGELTTPTGAAALKTLAKPDGIPSDMVVKGTGYGCGDREYSGWPNIFRSILSEVEDMEAEVYVVEADVDDMMPEEWDLALERLFDSGALDANLTQRIMKKGRPGVGIKVIAPYEKLVDVIDIVLTYTSSIGARYYCVERHVLPRREFELETKYGKVKVKEVTLEDGKRRYKAEHDDVKRLSVEKGLAIREINAEIAKIMSKRGQKET